jgi:hypothetical protein
MLGSVMAGTVELGTAYAETPPASKAGWQEEFTVATGRSLDGDTVTSGLSIAYARKSDASGKVYIKLAGTLASTYVYTADGSTDYPAKASEPAKFPGTDYWIGIDQNTVGKLKPAAGKYAQVSIKGLYTGLDVAGKYVAAKQTNQALRFFTGYISNNNVPSIVGTPLTGPKEFDHNGATYIPSDTSEPVRWRVHGQSVVTTTQTSTFLIWNGGTGTTFEPKTATYELTSRVSAANDAAPAASPDIGTVIIDYSAVNFGS